MNAFTNRRDRRMRLAALIVCALGLTLPAAAQPTEVIAVMLDQAQVARLPERVSTIVVGNPLIADVSVQASGTMVITGKGYGVTNLIALDRAGKVLLEKLIQVRGPINNVVVVYRGVDRESYSCTPICERRITLGDTPEFFEATIGQTGNRNLRAQSGAAPPGQAPAR
jgi:hypothetical protein